MSPFFSRPFLAPSSLPRNGGNPSPFPARAVGVRVPPSAPSAQLSRPPPPLSAPDTRVNPEPESTRKCDDYFQSGLVGGRRWLRCYRCSSNIAGKEEPLDTIVPLFKEQVSVVQRPLQMHKMLRIRPFVYYHKNTFVFTIKLCGPTTVICQMAFWSHYKCTCILKSYMRLSAR